jgi:hypothetical protein
VLVPVAVGLLLLGTTACSNEPERSAPALCEQLAAAQGLDEALATADATALEAQSAALRQAEQVAPPDIQPSVAALSQSVDALIATVDTATGERRAAVTEALRAQEASVDGLTAAGTAVATWSTANCGLDLDSGATVPTTPVPTTAPAPTAAP